MTGETGGLYRGGRLDRNPVRKAYLEERVEGDRGMTTQPETPESFVEHRSRGVLLTIPADYLLLHLGYFGVLPILAILLHAQLGPGSSSMVGAVLFVYNASIGAGCLLVAPWISRVAYRTGMASGLLCSAVGMGLLPYAHTTASLTGALVLSGAGMSVHGLLARSLIAEVIPGDAARNRVFSLIQVAVNVSAAIGPMVATSLYAWSGSQTLLSVVACCYLAASVVVATAVPGRIYPPPPSVRWPVSRSSLRSVRRDGEGIRTLLISVAGGFLYAQFFSAIALLIATSVVAGPRQGVLFVLNAVVVIAFQGPISVLVERRLRKGRGPLAAMRVGVAVFAFAMLMLGLLLWMDVAVFPALVVAIVIFSVAETVFTPIVNTAFARLPAASSVEAFNLRQIFLTFGESGGALCGAAIFLSVAGDGPGAPYWLILAAVGFLIVAGSRQQIRTSGAEKEGFG